MPVGGVRERLALLGRPRKFTVRFHMKRVGLLLLLMWSFPALAKECGDPDARHWSTVVRLAAGSVTLHWTGVYEGRQAVCLLSYRNSQGKTQTLEVWGEPELNVAESLVAFASCADDGCDSTLLVADIVRGVVLKATYRPRRSKPISHLSGPQGEHCRLRGRVSVAGRRVISRVP